MPEKNPLVGTWHLRSCEGRGSDGGTVQPFGPDPGGMLMYDERGNMVVTLMRSSRRSFASGDAMQATADEIGVAWSEFDAYSGTYTLDMEQGTVTHHVRQAKFPNWLGTEQIRYYRREGNRLILSSAPIRHAGSEWVFTLTWSREAE